MKPDDKNPSGSSPEGGSGGSALLDRDPGKAGDDMIEAQEAKATRSGLPDSSAGRAAGRIIRDRDREMDGEDANATQDLKTVRLVCLFCREVRLIHVPVECDTPKEVLWECLACQERWASRR